MKVYFSIVFWPIESVEFVCLVPFTIRCLVNFAFCIVGFMRKEA